MLVFMSFVIILYTNNLFLKYLILTFLISLIMKMLFDNNILNICLVIILVYGLFFMTEYILTTLVKTRIPLHNFMKNPINIYIAYFISRLFSIILIAVFFLKKNKLILENRYIYKFIFMSFITISGLISIIIPNKNIFISDKYLIPFVLVFNNIFIYYILNDFMKISNKLKMKSIGEERVRNELQLWKQLSEKDLTQRKIMHDYTNTLICISGLLEKDDLSGAKKYLKNISAEYKLSKSFVATGNSLVDVLINTKYEKSLKNGITMILKLDNLTNIKIKSEDLIVLISNLLDNAIEYCLKLEKNKREIFFSIYIGEKIEVMVRNPLENKVVIDNNLIESTKKDKENHGLGLVNVKEIVEKYKGEHYIDVDDGYFTHYIEI